MAQPFAVGSLAERAQAVRAATVGLAALLALTNWACKPKFHQALPPDVEAHFAAANSWDVYELPWTEETRRRGRPQLELAGYRFDAASRKVTVDGEKLLSLRSTIRAGIEAWSREPPTLVPVLDTEYLVVASHGGQDMAMVFQYADPSTVGYYSGTPSSSGSINMDVAPCEFLRQLFQPVNQEQAR